MRYEGNVFRPPSEAYSYILQVTIGCARNTCTFCSMYKDKSFRIRPLEDIVEDLQMAKAHYRSPVKKVFLADGDALIMKTQDLLYILAKIHELLPSCERITTYAAPRDILQKSDADLKALQEAGLDMAYMGAESGDDQVLAHIRKGVTSSEIVEAGKKIRRSGIRLSVTYISGLGGRSRMQEHALRCAQTISLMNPEFVGFLTLMLEPGTPLYEEHAQGEFELLRPEEVLTEMELIISNIDSPGTVFRSNHASNYISLKGTFNEDKTLLLSQLKEAKEQQRFKAEEYRGL
ncbi:MAG: radical SAM protein [Lachnospiraceae bacterium]